MTAAMHNQAPIVWEQRFDTGVPDIDQQHHVLVSTLNEANQTLLHETRRDAVDRLLQDLLAYALYHFETEEALMQEHGYADHDATTAQQHVEAHRRFAQRVVNWRNTLDATGDVDRDAMLAFLNGWLQQHILGIDQQLATFLHARGVAA